MAKNVLAGTTTSRPSSCSARGHDLDGARPAADGDGVRALVAGGEGGLELGAKRPEGERAGLQGTVHQLQDLGAVGVVEHDPRRGHLHAAPRGTTSEAGWIASASPTTEGLRHRAARLTRTMPILTTAMGARQAAEQQVLAEEHHAED